jgi:hypothetical protein
VLARCLPSTTTRTSLPLPFHSWHHKLTHCATHILPCVANPRPWSVEDGSAKKARIPGFGAAAIWGEGEGEGRKGNVKARV